MQKNVHGNSATATSASECTGNSATATKLQHARKITLDGAVSGSALFDGSENTTINTTQNNIKTFYIKLKVGNQNIEYPIGFNKNNTIILNCMKNEGNKWITSEMDNAGDIHNIADIWLQDNNIFIQGEFDKEYKIVLMKLPEYIEGEDYILGDVNQDGEITEEDAILVQNFNVGLETLTEQQIKAADVNKDGKIDSADVLMIKKYSLGVIDSFE